MSAVEASAVPEAGSGQPVREKYLDYLRAIAAVAVVLFHSAPAIFHTGPVRTLDWQLVVATNSLMRWPVPVFFMISGALFLAPQKNITIRSIWTKYVPRILLLFVFWSAAYVALRLALGGRGLMASLMAFLNGPIHLWFLIAIMGLYILTPVLRKIVENRELAWYYVGLGVLFASFGPLISQLPLIGEVFDYWFKMSQFTMVANNTLYFVLGYLLATTEVRAWVAKLCCGVGLLGTTIGVATISAVTNRPNFLFGDFLSPTVLLAAVGIFLLAKSWQRESKLSRLLADNSLGIYLTHLGIIQVLQAAKLPLAAPVLMLVYFTVALLGSLLLTMVLKKIPVVGKRIV